MYAKSTSRYYRGGKRIKEKKNAAGQIRIIITGRFIRAQSERGGNDVSYRLRSTRRRGAGEPENSNPRQSFFFFLLGGYTFTFTAVIFSSQLYGRFGPDTSGRTLLHFVVFQLFYVYQETKSINRKTFSVPGCVAKLREKKKKTIKSGSD